MANTHLDHFEESILHNPAIGLVLVDRDSANTEVSVKYDGSPAVFFGEHPESGRFFVGTKSIFNKQNKKFVYELSDIQEHGYEGKLAKILTDVYSKFFLQDFNGKSYQADFLFSSEDVEVKTLGYEKYLLFQPNALIYGIRANDQEAKEILSTDLGLCVHTVYSDQYWIPEPVSELTNFPCVEDVYTIPPETFEFPDELKIDYNSYLKLLELDSVQQFLIKDSKLSGSFQGFRLKTFINELIMSGKLDTNRPKDYIFTGSEYLDFMKRKFEMKFKSPRQSTIDRFNEHYEFVSNSFLDYICIVDLIVNAMVYKKAVLRDLNRVPKIFRTFKKSVVSTWTHHQKDMLFIIKEQSTVQNLLTEVTFLC